MILTVIYFVFFQEAECVQPAEELDHIFKVEQIHQFFQEFEKIFPFLDISDLSNYVLHNLPLNLPLNPAGWKNIYKNFMLKREII